jgi:hypothetical protein
MLFLAVFCGFLAENFREHQIENQRGKKYIQSLIKDLKDDTAEIRSVISYNITKFRGLDTLATLLNQPILSEEDEKELYRLNGTYASNIYTLIFNDRTMRQLLNSGNMRLLKQSISDSVMNYYGQPKDDILGQEKVYEEMSKRLIFFMEDIFDKSLSPLKINENNEFYREKKPDKISLLTRENQVLKKYSQIVITAQSMLSVYLEMLFYIEIEAKRLLPFLEKNIN